MCNAAKHSPGCDCGFGPPYPPGYSVGEVREWAEEVLDDSRLVRQGLEEMAWDETSIEAFVQRYFEIKNADLPRDTMVSRIRQLLGMRRKVTEKVTVDWINVPLYQFAAPPVRGASVEFGEGESLTEGAGWSVRVFGIGAGNTATLQVSRARTYTAENGNCKIVLVPVKLQVAHIAVYDNNRLIGRGYEAQVAPVTEGGDNQLRRRECRSLPPERAFSGPEEAEDILELSLAHDNSDSIHKDKRTWETDVAHEVLVKLKNLADVSALVKVKRTRRLELSFSLPAGHDYVAYICTGSTWWKTPRRRASSEVVSPPA
jgi:hypothetical protein